MVKHLLVHSAPSPSNNLEGPDTHMLSFSCNPFFPSQTFPLDTHSKCVSTPPSYKTRPQSDDTPSYWLLYNKSFITELNYSSCRRQASHQSLALCPSVLSLSRTLYCHATHNDISVNNGLHIRWWSHNIIIYYNTIVLELPTVFSTVTCCTGLQPRSNRL